MTNQNSKLFNLNHFAFYIAILHFDF